MNRLMLIAALSSGLLIPVAVTSTAGASPSASVGRVTLVQDHPDQAKAKDKKHKKDKPAKAIQAKKPKKAKGPGPGNHGNATAPGQLKKADRGADPRGAQGSNEAASNENEKITFCHVPPGNPANGRLITTSVNAIQPGHVNHPGDIIPPFTFTKRGETVSFNGQNWDAAGRATLANGCDAVVDADPLAASAGADNPETAAVLDSGAAATKGVEEDDGLVNGVLPEAGGPRLAVLALALGLVSAGVLMLARHRRRPIG